MILSLAGLNFKAHSPSHFELLSVRDDVGTGDTVHILYEQPGWAIVYRKADGGIVSRTFRSRDAAIDLIASRAS